MFFVQHPHHDHIYVLKNEITSLWLFMKLLKSYVKDYVVKNYALCCLIIIIIIIIIMIMPQISRHTIKEGNGGQTFSSQKQSEGLSHASAVVFHLMYTSVFIFSKARRSRWAPT